MIAKVQYLTICLAIIGGLTACSSTRTGSLCTAGPIILDTGATERLTRGEKEQIVTLNESGETICGWKAPQ
jgi:hypothetical protein